MCWCCCLLVVNASYRNLNGSALQDLLGLFGINFEILGQLNKKESSTSFDGFSHCIAKKVQLLAAGISI